MPAAELQQRPPTPAAGALSGLSRLPAVKQLGVMVALAASVAVGVGVILWSRTPSYSLLYGSVSGREATEIAQALERASIAYRIDQSSGAILVPSGEVHKARIKLAGDGLPRGAEPGFEILQQDQGFGTSQFVERARFQRALEVELARSISSLNAVQSARIHLALPKQSVFVRERRNPSASVLVNLYPGRVLEEGQVAAVTHLVAASVPNLEPADVKVVDERGNMLTPDQSGEAAVTRKQFDYTRKLESYYIQRIEDILSPVLGPEGVKAQVVADVDFTRTEQTQERYEPQPQALRSEQVFEERGARAGAGGIPGALSNQPPAPASVPEQVPESQAGAAQSPEPGITRSTKKATRNYEVDRTISHTLAPSATVRRLSAAVVLDDVRERGQNGRRSLTPEELERYTGLIKKAIGYDEARGDSVSVVNVPFNQPEAPQAVPEAPLWEQPWLWEAGKQLLAVAIVLFMVLAVLRPAMRRLTTHEIKMRELGPPPGGAERALAEDKLRLGSAESGQVQRDQVAALQAMVTEDPRRVAQVVRNWVNEDE